MVEANPPADQEKQQPAGDNAGEHQPMPVWAQMSGKLGIGSITGYMAGNFIKQVSDEAIMYTGLAVILIGGLHWMRWITINWKQIDADMLGLWERVKAKGEDGLFAKMKRMVLRTAPLLGGFSAGFWFGFTNG